MQNVVQVGHSKTKKSVYGRTLIIPSWHIICATQQRKLYVLHVPGRYVPHGGALTWSQDHANGGTGHVDNGR